MSLDIEPISEPNQIAAAPLPPIKVEGVRAPEPQATPSWREWLRQGFRATFGLRLGSLPPEIHPVWVLCLFALATAFQMAARRMEIDGAAVFSLSGWLYGWAETGIALSVLGWLFWVWRPYWRHPNPVMAWLTLEWVTALVFYTVGAGWSAFALSGHYPAILSSSQGRWGVFAVFIAWGALTQWRIAQALVHHRGAIAALVVAVSAVGVLGALWLRSSPWEYGDGSEAQKPRLELSQSVFEQQQALFQMQAQGLLASDGAKPRVYGLVYAPYEGDVFLRESQLFTSVMVGRFGAESRTLSLLNHVSTTATTPWATPTNLERALKSIGEKMDRDQDVLLLYLTSHGGSDHKLASRHWPLNVSELTAAQVRKMLDDAGIRYSAVLVSACYSGGWIDPLKADTRLVMTAADKDHTSYGCGARSELTFFGRAMFDEELRKTRSLEQAFAQAVPRIQQREIEAGKDDGFSNPQIAVGPAFRQHWADVVQPALDAVP